MVNPFHSPSVSMATTIRVKASSKLSLPLPPPIQIHALDLVVPAVYAPLFFYFPPVTTSISLIKETIINLITSLSDVLEHFPLLAGSMRPDGSGRLYVYSDNTGADFSYELRRERFPGKHVKGLDPRGDRPVIPSADKPLLAVKFTVFSCGTYVMCFSGHHTVVDLTSMMDFVYAYSRQMNNKPHNTVPRYWTRDPMSYFPPSTHLLSEIPGFKILPPDSDSKPSPPGLPPPTDLIPVYTTNQQMERMKKSLSSPSTTTFQILTVLLWRASVRVCYPDIRDDEAVNLGIAVNGRERSPNKVMVKEHYFGNFNPAVGVSVKKSQLLSGSISDTATTIQNALRTQLTLEYIATKVKTLESLPAWRFAPDNHCQLTSWSKEMMLGEDLNFGFVDPGSKEKVEVGSGEDTPFPNGNIQDMMLNDDVHKITFAVPRGKGGILMHDAELLKWGQFTMPEARDSKVGGGRISASL